MSVEETAQWVLRDLDTALADGERRRAYLRQALRRVVRLHADGELPAQVDGRDLRAEMAGRLARLRTAMVVCVAGSVYAVDEPGRTTCTTCWSCGRRCST